MRKASLGLIATYWPFLFFGTRLKITDSLLALFTLGLVVHGRAINYQTVDLARAEFISTHRPKIRLRRITPIGKLLPNTRTNLTIEAANIGDSKATITEIGFDIYIE